jgi:uncharacterized protein YtpQ (UPF0354 family)
VSFLRRIFGKKTKPPERDEDRFARLVIAALRERDPSVQVEYDPEKFELLHVDDAARGQRVFLHNSFAEYGRMSAAEQDVHLNRIISFILESRKQAPKGDAALDRLLPVIRPRADMLGFAIENGQFGYDRSSRPFCDTMLLMLAMDSDVSIALLTDEKLDELGVSFDDALGIAVAQLDEMGSHTIGQLEDGVFITVCQDHYDASRVLMPEMFEQLPVRGNPVAIIQSRSCVLITGSNDINGLDKIATIALEEFSQTERAVSLTPIILQNGEWQPFKLEPHHPQSLRNLATHQLSWCCNATAQALRTKLRDDVFVANPMLIEKDGVAGTIVAWGAGVPTACPMVDAVAIQEDEGFEQIIRSMKDVIQVCGALPEVEAMPYPPRHMLPDRLSTVQRIELTNNFPEFDLNSADR